MVTVFNFVEVVLVPFLITCLAEGSNKLETYNVTKNQISLSGFSSGGFFAVQFHVAFSESIMGAGIVAGGPYWCSKGNWSVAKAECLTTAGNASIDDYANKVMEASKAGKIDNPSYLPTDWVYLFSSANDTVVSTAIVKNAEQFYRNFVAKGFLMSEYDRPGEHAMPTDNFGNPCLVLGSPYISNCGFSLAERILEAIYNIGPELKKEETYCSQSSPTNSLIEFDQSEFIESANTSMDSIGYIYVPTSCQNKTKSCRLHLVFHGCEQGRDKIGDEFATRAEYNKKAEANNIIVLYPQIKSVPVTNPLGCWDWTGYTNSDYIYKDGLQMATVKRMLDRVAGLKI